jgi:RNA polymerase sigma factor (sigma-70 family)
MATSHLSDFLQNLRGAVLRRDGAGLTDGQLLAAFIEQRNEAAITALVRRHGAMVWGVCRRVLANHHDAEDAFQATFLVLVRKATAVVPREMVGNWLYGVACQTARKARTTTGKRKARERQVTAMPEPAAVEQDLWNDLQPLLDRELSLLPDKYRVPIVLCDLEGKTRKEAARQVGVPDGTLAARLARGQVLLAKRLGRQGLMLSGGSLAVLLSRDAATAGVPASVLSTTIKAATVFAAGKTAAAGVLSVNAVALTEGVLKTMLLAKLKIATAVLLVVGFTGVAALGVTLEARGAEIGHAQAQERPVAPPLKTEPPPPEKKVELDLADLGYFPPAMALVVKGQSHIRWLKYQHLDPELQRVYPLADLVLPIPNVEDLAADDADALKAMRQARRKVLWQRLSELDAAEELLAQPDAKPPIRVINVPITYRLLNVEEAAAKKQGIAKIQASLKELAQGTDEKAEQQALDKIESAVKEMKDKDGRQLRRQTYAKLLAIARLEASLDDLAQSKDDKSEKEALAKVEKALAELKQKIPPAKK